MRKKEDIAEMNAMSDCYAGSVMPDSIADIRTLGIERFGGRGVAGWQQIRDQEGAGRCGGKELDGFRFILEV